MLDEVRNTPHTLTSLTLQSIANSGPANDLLLLR